MMTAEQCSVEMIIKELPHAKTLAFRFMICAACSKCTEAPVYTCKVGHPVCGECCKTDLTYCPFMEPNSQRACQQKYISLPMNLHQYLHDNSIFYCPLKNFGCPMLMKGRYIKDHLDCCDYRKLPKCIFPDCDMYSCELTEYHLHLIMDHDADTIVNNNAELQLLFDSAVRQKYPRRSPCVFVYYGAKFVLVIYDYDGRVAMWIALIHGPSNQKYKAVFRIPIIPLKGDGKNGAKGEDAPPTATHDGDTPEENGHVATTGDEKATTEDEPTAVIADAAAAKEEDGLVTPSAEEKATTDEIITNGESSSATVKGEDKIIEHDVHTLSMSDEDILDLCECVDMPTWLMETTHLVKDANNRLILPFKIEIQCTDCNYDDEDITIGIDDDDYIPQPDAAEE